MSIGDAWDSMDSSTKNLVIEIYNRYLRTGSSDDLRYLREIFQRFGYSGADENELKRVLRR